VANEWQNPRRKDLYRLLGDLPDPSRPIGVRKVAEETRESYVLETLTLDLNGIEDVPAYFVRPQRGNGRYPVVLYNHAHGGDYVLGKDELLNGRGAIYDPPYAEALASRGYAALAIDTWLFGERRGRSESELFKQMLWQGQVLWGMMVYDSLRAIDYLSSRADVDPDRIATLGLSMGSTMAWWVAALDERVKVCIDLCCLTDFQALIETRGLDGHGIYYYVPPAQAIRHRWDQRVDRPATTPLPGGQLRPAHPAKRAGARRHRAAEGVRRTRQSGRLEASALRHRPLRDRGHASGDYGVLGEVGVRKPACTPLPGSGVF